MTEVLKLEIPGQEVSFFWIAVFNGTDRNKVITSDR